MRKWINETSGATWGKWDLHVHSPSSLLNNQFTTWPEYFSVLESLKDIRVLGITDYYSIEGYQKVKEYKDSGKLTNIDLILPNVEMRLNSVTLEDRPINIHVIFSPESEVISQIESKFFRELKYSHNQTVFTCTKDDLVSLGRLTAKGQTLSESAAHREGMNQFKVSIDELKRVLTQNAAIFEGKYVVVAANKSTDGVSGLRESSMEIEQQKIYHFAHAIFSSRAKDREFFLGEIEKYPPEFIYRNYGSLKPCIHGSDAHQNDKICKPDLNRFTWIKSEPTFEGLLQIVHEPNIRLKIQDMSPGVKSDYNVIDSVRFFDDKFSGREISLNPELNTIIGGKSSGKSLMLYKIAQAVSPVEVKRAEEDEHWKNPYSKTFIDTMKFEVTWKNGAKSTLDKPVGTITYIPQMYINALAEDTSSKDLQGKIIEILVRNPENSSVMEALSNKNKDLIPVIRADVERLFARVADLQTKSSELSKIGARQAVLTEREKLIASVEERVKASNLSEPEEKRMQELESMKTDLQKFLANTRVSKDLGRQALKIVEDLSKRIDIELKPEFTARLRAEYQGIIGSLRTDITRAFEEASLAMDNQIAKDTLTEGELSEKIRDVDLQLTPFIEKVKAVSDISDLRKRIDEQSQVIATLDALEVQVSTIREELSSTASRLTSNFQSLYNSRVTVRNHFSERSDLAGLKLISRLKFNQEVFEESFLSLFDRRGRISNALPAATIDSMFDEKDHFDFDETTYLSNMEILFSYLISADSDSLKLRRTKTKQMAVEQLLTASLPDIVFDLEKDGDNLSQMSPGKRGLVLLELFLGMSTERHPILIDQPEDNLDNRTISTELVRFIREKKWDRQIILVTHNANLVVLTDADNVIVANQDAQLRENESFRFEYVNGALECNFVEKGFKIVNKGIRSHVCEILEGGQDAFLVREKKYGF